MDIDASPFPASNRLRAKNALSATTLAADNLAPTGEGSGVALTKKGEAYAALHLPAGRKAIEQQIETLIAILDELDGDPDLEPYLADFRTDATDDREDDPVDRGEPSLGWTDMEARYGCSPTPSYDCEEEHDGREPDADSEPNLGAPELGGGPALNGGVYKGAPLVDCTLPRNSQEHWARGRGDDDEPSIGTSVIVNGRVYVDVELDEGERGA